MTADHPQRVRPSRPPASPGCLHRQRPAPVAAPLVLRWQYDSAGRLLVQDGTLPGQEQWRWDMAGNPLEGVGEKNAHSRPDLLDGEGNKILNTKGLPIKTRQYEFRDSNNKPVFIQEHSLGHDKATSGHGAEPHFTVRPSQNLNTGSVPGSHGHYNFES
ncbi:hypothetical protein KAH50_22880 [Enterobacter roggenkampii]|nr:hypothetical protein [Enterobacter roggenkampii]MBQ0300968.1 hypothetical protein [Enterobacter roggenkampii]HCU0590954.1 hypothetical protein [Enterobacter roggenkampii]HDT2123400.1 hypothetical protein [Enterobacter roggenkampii]